MYIVHELYIQHMYSFKCKYLNLTADNVFSYIITRKSTMIQIILLSNYYTVFKISIKGKHHGLNKLA